MFFYMRDITFYTFHIIIVLFLCRLYNLLNVCFLFGHKKRAKTEISFFFTLFI